MLMAGSTPERCGFVCREVTAELGWVLERAYRFSGDRVSTVLYELVATEELLLKAPATSRAQTADTARAELTSST